jgi:acyl carrier protein
MTLNQSSGNAPVTDPTEIVHEIVVGVAGVDVRADESFFDLGLESIQLMQICNSINERFGEVIDLFLLFENPTVNDCAAVIAAAQPAG